MDDIRYVRVDCFAYGEKPSGKPDCAALLEVDCWGCAFYKTREQLEQEQRKAKERLEEFR